MRTLSLIATGLALCVTGCPIDDRYLRIERSEDASGSGRNAGHGRSGRDAAAADDASTAGKPDARVIADAEKSAPDRRTQDQRVADVDAGAFVGSLAVTAEASTSSQFDELAYEIFGSGFARAGAVELGSNRSLTFSTEGVPVGNAYTIHVVAVTRSSQLECVGDADFAIPGGEVTRLTVNLRCASDHDGAAAH